MLFTRDGSNSEFNPYHYAPAKWASVLGAILFSSVAIAQLWLFFRGRSWLFWAMIIGVLMEALGFCTRAFSVYNLTESGRWAYIVSLLCLVLAPSFIAAACYVTFGRIVWLVAPRDERNFKTLWFPPRFVSIIFVLFDIGAFLIQLSGATELSSAVIQDDISAKEAADKTRRGVTILRVGLILQLICFGLFVIVGSRFIIISRRWTDRPLQYDVPSTRWQRLNWTTNAAATVIMIRAFYRIFEFSSDIGKPSYLERHEWTFWLLDGIPVFACLVAFTLFHPSKYLPSQFQTLRMSKRRFLKQEESQRRVQDLNQDIEMR
ncbi:RTA1-domain-containing protein [Aaosphaeria arxii CBS 175.79]|uniref:RTA1-domain-containing protein n=1 Tax=Aaosphaeria arxii CBS 175.79 TaxID=1450172 RepID=A0A6A5YB31_9PLEO|nr:RTA1-domain-containing protein [Aaosphaeria arxii CBS 175.79]KAF2022237.1 RTA1-domain-containing protein [Aaosphaeria arxii CBS 175.79]